MLGVGTPDLTRSWPLRVGPIVFAPTIPCCRPITVWLKDLASHANICHAKAMTRDRNKWRSVGTPRRMPYEWEWIPDSAGECGAASWELSVGTRRDVTANQIRRHVHVTSQKTARHMSCLHIKEAIADNASEQGGAVTLFRRLGNRKAQVECWWWYGGSVTLSGLRPTLM